MSGKGVKERENIIMQFDLVFEGGGAKGIAFAGAITASLMAAVYTSNEMLAAVNERLPNGKPRFASFMDIPEKFEAEDINNSLAYELFKKVDIPWIPEWMEHKVDEAVLNQLMKMDVYRLSSRDDEVRKVMGDADPDEVPNLGLLIDETMTVEGAPDKEKYGTKEEIQEKLSENILRLKPVQRIRNLVDTMTNAHDRLAIEEHEKEVCRLPAKGYGTTEFDMSDGRRQAIVEAGQMAMKEHLDARGF